jgi:hypothetical protein
MGWVWEAEEWLEGMFYSFIDCNAMTDEFFLILAESTSGWRADGGSYGI